AGPPFPVTPRPPPPPGPADETEHPTARPEGLTPGPPPDHPHGPPRPTAPGDRHRPGPQHPLRPAPAQRLPRPRHRRPEALQGPGHAPARPSSPVDPQSRPHAP